MRKLYLFLCFLEFGLIANAQADTTLSAKDKAALDSMISNLFFSDSIPNKSYVDISVSMGNGFFSTNNNSFNVTQSQTQQLFYTPTFAYYHKSGLGISLTSYITNDKGKPKIYQYSITPFWEFSSKNVAGAISYTRNINGEKTSFDVSPFKNDFFGNLELIRPKIKPGIALGFSTGKNVEYFDTAFVVAGMPRRIKDTITTKLKALSVTLSASHSFEYEKIFSKNDGILIKPTLLLNASSYKWDIRHSNSLYQRRPATQRLLKNKFGDGKGEDKLALQSLGLSFDIIYSIGKFYFQPNVYFDYYLPETTTQRFSSIFSLTAGLSF